MYSNITIQSEGANSMVTISQQQQEKTHYLNHNHEELYKTH